MLGSRTLLGSRLNLAQMTSRNKPYIVDLDRREASKSRLLTRHDADTPNTIGQ